MKNPEILTTELSPNDDAYDMGVKAATALYTAMIFYNPMRGPIDIQMMVAGFASELAVQMGADFKKNFPEKCRGEFQATVIRKMSERLLGMTDLHEQFGKATRQ